jgi:PPOX class probable FMN-dependent enzyme
MASESAVESFSAYLPDAVTSVEVLEGVYGQPDLEVQQKVTDTVDPLTARYIAACPLVLVGSHSAEGRVDVTPRGGPPGFVKVLGRRLLAIPDKAGNRRLDTMHNVLETGRVGALFLVPGRRDAVRVNGRALVSARPELLDRIGDPQKPSKLALLIEPDEVFVHCPRALRASQVWQPEEWQPTDDVPDLMEMYEEHIASKTTVVG